jgi:transmembrane sensor
VDRNGLHAEESGTSSLDEQAAQWFLRRARGPLKAEEEAALHAWLAEGPLHAQAWREISTTWGLFEDQVTLPELVVAREQALAGVRRAQVQRWKRPSQWASRWLAAAVIAGLALGVAYWQIHDRGDGNLSTGVGEQRTVLLADNSRVALDALTQIRVLYTGGARTIELLGGQAQFEVAQDARRPFRVRAGSRVIEALGTSFTVEYVQRHVRIALLEGRVRIESAASSMELQPGEMLRIEPNGQQKKEARTDLAVATAWRQGKVIFRAEPLNAAVNRLNRYSHVRLEVADPSIARLPISGVFDAADAEAFAEAVASYFPIKTEHSRSDVIELRHAH